MLKRTILIGFFLLCISPSAQAAELFSGEQYTLPTNQIVDDNSIVASGETTINGTIKGDLIVTSGQTIINGTVEGDVLMAGGSLILNQDSVVHKDIRTMSGELISKGLVKGTIQA
ncbi:polymer-forming cytoskeletal protein, partial [Candidatus Gracilibacteria bacterium]|nr:polymer-forming cytoskeletal protein [Candidatus Gracilibacteria bacterium]